MQVELQQVQVTVSEQIGLFKELQAESAGYKARISELGRSLASTRSLKNSTGTKSISLKSAKL